MDNRLLKYEVFRVCLYTYTCDQHEYKCTKYGTYLSYRLVQVKRPKFIPRPKSTRFFGVS